jgi:hypothetical protein
MNWHKLAWRLPTNVLPPKNTFVPGQQKVVTYKQIALLKGLPRMMVQCNHAGPLPFCGPSLWLPFLVILIWPSGSGESVRFIHHYPEQSLPGYQQKRFKGAGSYDEHNIPSL